MISRIYSQLNKKKFYISLSLLLVVIAGEILLTCVIPMWREYFFNILNTKDVSNFTSALWAFLTLLLGLGTIQGLKTWLSQRAAFQVRVGGSKLFLKLWTKGKKRRTNYTQPMTESLQIWTDMVFSNSVEVLISASIIIGLVITNYHSTVLMSAALAYTVVLTIMAALFNKPLTTSESDRQTAEGVYREAISDIANDNGDYSSKAKFLQVINSYYRYINVLMYFTLFSRVKSSAAVIIPYVLLSYDYFSGASTLGQFMAGVATFELLVTNSTILLAIYPQYTKMLAAYRLSLTFYDEVKSNE